MKQITIATLLAFAALVASANTTYAQIVAEQEQSQELKQELEAECKFGAYAESAVCKLYGKQKASQEQSQRQQILAAHSGEKIHIPADTAMDVQAVSFILAAGALGLASAVALTKIA